MQLKKSFLIICGLCILVLGTTGLILTGVSNSLVHDFIFINKGLSVGYPTFDEFAQIQIHGNYTPTSGLAGGEALEIDSTINFSPNCTACGLDVLGMYPSINTLPANHSARISGAYISSFPNNTIQGTIDNWAGVAIDNQGIAVVTGFANITRLWGLWIAGDASTAGNINGNLNSLPGRTFIGPSSLNETGVPKDGALIFAPILFANLGTPTANGVVLYCSNCTIANPCASGGNGAMAKRLNGVWVCN